MAERVGVAGTTALSAFLGSPLYSSPSKCAVSPLVWGGAKGGPFWPLLGTPAPKKVWGLLSRAQLLRAPPRVSARGFFALSGIWDTCSTQVGAARAAQPSLMNLWQAYLPKSCEDCDSKQGHTPPSSGMSSSSILSWFVIHIKDSGKKTHCA